MRILVVFGTRPEAIKLSPVIKALKNQSDFIIKVCVTAQHRQMLDQVLSLFNIVPDVDLNLMGHSQSLTQITETVIVKIENIIKEFNPDFVIVQGDTTTTFSASLAAYYQKVPVAHVEAGLRTGDLYAPWPEEGNRKLTTALADLHFAPTQIAYENLIKEGIPKSKIDITGNTVIDALIDTSKKLNAGDSSIFLNENLRKIVESGEHFLLVTCHRRESFGTGLENICLALLELATKNKIQIIFPVHLNPKVQEPVKRILMGEPKITLLPPLDYLPFVKLMKACYLILTDSGGIQEEAPALGKPVLIMRDKTERPEAIDAGTAQLVGAESEQIVANTVQLLNSTEKYRKMATAKNPFGDGQASKKIVERLRLELKYR